MNPSHRGHRTVSCATATSTAVDNIGFDIAPGELVTLLGPSGCGKTTTLRAVAGLETPTAGSIRLNGETVYSAASGATCRAKAWRVDGVPVLCDLAAHDGVRQRRLRSARAQTAACRGAAERAARAGPGADAGLADRPASKLSGGQQQRVAVARAIAFSPSVLLFDEPLSNLDAKLRAEMRVELRELQRRLDITSLYVTHDQEEALAISDRVIVMNGGQIEQIGSPEDIYNRPLSRFVADFVGSANLIKGKVRGPSGKNGTLMFDAERGHAAGGCRRRRIAQRQDTVALRSSYMHLGRTPLDRTTRCGHHPPPHVPRRFHSVRRGLASRTVDRAPPANRTVRRRQQRDGVIRTGALCAALTVRPPSSASASARRPSAAPRSISRRVCAIISSSPLRSRAQDEFRDAGLDVIGDARRSPRRRRSRNSRAGSRPVRLR